MKKRIFEEHMIHGTADFPVGVYPMEFGREQDVLFPLHYHREFEILVITRGRVKVQLEGKSLLLGEGEGIFINSGLLHSAVQAEPAPCGFLAVVFSPELIAGRQEELYEKYVRELIKRENLFPCVLSGEAVQLAREIGSLFRAGEYGYELRIKGKLTLLLADCIGDSPGGQETPGEDSRADIVRKALDYIHENYREDVSLSELAEHTHVSREHLCRIFRQVSGFSPMGYLNRYRILQSAWMLHDTDKSISEIATCCGFNHCSYFNRLFYRFMKCSPTEYRRGLRG